MSKNLQFVALAGAGLISFCLWLNPTSTASPATSAGSRPFPESDARSLYTKNCATCHGKDGRSKVFKGKLTHARDLTDAQWQDQVSDERIYNSIANGKGKMPAFKKKLSEADINSLTSFVRNLKK